LGTLSWQVRPQNPDGFALMLARGRVLVQEAHDAGISAESGMNRVTRTEHLVLSTVDAKELGIEKGEPLTLVAESGVAYEGVANISDSMLPGMISLTTLFGELAAEIQASDRPDPMNHLPRLRTLPVRIEKRGSRNE
jgi:predicted molibdopterin-dependent oxidoreductase YjgC